MKVFINSPVMRVADYKLLKKSFNEFRNSGKIVGKLHKFSSRMYRLEAWFMSVDSYLNETQNKITRRGYVI